jgi:2'-5' RNA ligase
VTLRALFRRMVGARRRASALIVPVPNAEPAVGGWREQLDPTAAAGMPAHITLLYPFLAPGRIDPSVEQELEQLFGRFGSFRFALTRVERFEGVLYLAPDPQEPFVELTRAVEARWPDHPPYEGAFDTVVPHLTVVQGKEPPGVEEALKKALPLETEATEVRLMVQGDDRRWSARARFPLAPEALA